MFKDRATHVMKGLRHVYYTQLIVNNRSDQRKLFHQAETLLSGSSEVSFPARIPPNEVANNFENNFVLKVDTISSSLDAQEIVSFDGQYNSCVEIAGEPFATFKALTSHQVARLIHIRQLKNHAN